MNKNNIKLYNVIFPIWMLFLYPFTWIAVLPINFVIDSIALIVGLILLKQKNVIKKYFKCILKVVFFGFFSDFVGAAFLFALTLIPSKEGGYYETMIRYIFENPFKTVFCLLLYTIAVLISGYLIYVLNKKFTFKKLEMEIEEVKKIALFIAIVTAPYLFYIPTTWFY